MAVLASAGDVALIVLAAFWGLLVLGLCLVLVNTFNVLTSTKMLIDGIREETVPLLSEVRNSVVKTNRELDRVDGMLESAANIVARVEKISKLVEQAASGPLVRIISLGAGLSTGVRQTTIALPGRATVCFHTDGLVEARRQHQAAQVRRLGTANGRGQPARERAEGARVTYAGREECRGGSIHSSEERRDFGLVSGIAQPVGEPAAIGAVIEVGDYIGFTIPTEVVKYALGHYGAPLAPVAPDVMDRIMSMTEARRLAARAPLPPMVERVRARLGAGVSDDELLLRIMFPEEHVEAMLARARMEAA